MNKLRPVQIAIPSPDCYGGSNASAYAKKLLGKGFSEKGVVHLLGEMAACGMEEVTHIRVGNDFCENLLPCEEAIKSFVSLCEDEHLSLTLVTPPVTDFGLMGIGKCLDVLAGSSIDVQLVINDYGAYRAVRFRDEFDGEIVAGRLLFRQPFDPRMGVDAEVLPSGQLDRALRNIGITTIESDLPQRQFAHPDSLVDDSEEGSELNESTRRGLLVPCTYVTTGRVCFYRGLDKCLPDKFVIKDDQRHCNRRCANEYSFLTCESVDTKKPLLFVQRGNAILFPNHLESYELFGFDYLVIDLC